MTAAAGRRPLIAGNWKMHKTSAEARALVRELCLAPETPGVDVVVAPPFTALPAAGEELRAYDRAIALAAQTMHESDHGPFTGEVSPPMLCELGVEYVILGHSERRAFCGETDAGVNRKVRSALAHGLTPIVAVGETEAEHREGLAIAVVVRQTRAAFGDVAPGDVARCIVAYEPIWAIGTGLVDRPESANATMGAIRSSVEGLEAARLLYGGSMKSENAAALMAQPHIDGGLVGGASLNAASFLGIVLAARARAEA